MKKLFKSKLVLVWSPLAMLASIILALAFPGAITIILSILVVMTSAVNALWHVLDDDVIIKP